MTSLVFTEFLMFIQRVLNLECLENCATASNSDASSWGGRKFWKKRIRQWKPGNKNVYRVTDVYFALSRICSLQQHVNCLPWFIIQSLADSDLDSIFLTQRCKPSSNEQDTLALVSQGTNLTSDDRIRCGKYNVPVQRTTKRN